MTDVDTDIIMEHASAKLEGIVRGMTYVIDKYDREIYVNPEGYVLFCQDYKNGHLWYSHNYIYKELLYVFGDNPKEINKFIGVWFKENIGWGGLPPKLGLISVGWEGLPLSKRIL